MTDRNVQVEQLKNKLAAFGLAPAMADIYIHLLRHGPLTALQLSRALPYSRTQTYRHLEDLQALQIVSCTQFAHGSVYEALPPEQLEQIVVSKQAEARSLHEKLTEVKSLFGHFQTGGGPRAKVLHYSGVEGIKQVNWNLTKAQNEYRVFEVAHLSQYLDKNFAARCRARTIEQGVRTFDLTNTPESSIKDLEPFDPSLSQLRYIEPSVLAIKFEMFIYNDIVTQVDYSGDEIFCIEVYHPALKAMQMQLFDAMWRQAVPVKLV
jgi:sugar-specific transcriptional regulator TrmB